MSSEYSSRTNRRRAWHRAAVTAAVAVTGLGLVACSSGPAGTGSGTSNSSSAGKALNSSIGVTLVLKELTNPYFVTMEKDAKAEAAKVGVNLTVAAGKSDGDAQSQISAIENAVSRGDKGVIVTPASDSINAALLKARSAGLLTVALDTPPTPANVVDITYATDNLKAGTLIGNYAAAKLGGKPAVIAMLDAFNDQVQSVDVARDVGFLQGMGINPGSTKEHGKEAKSGKYSKGTYTIACQQATQGAQDQGRTAMEECLSKNPSINVVYAITEPAARGANLAIKAAGKDSQISVFTIDGSCQGISDVESGVFTAESAQYPGTMAAKGVQAIATLARNGTKPKPSPGLDFFNTGTALVTAKPVDGVASQTVAEGKAKCWGA